MAMKRMMKMNILNSGKGKEEGRYRGNEEYGQSGGYDRMREGRNERGREPDWRGGMNERGWDEPERMRRGEMGRYRDYDDRDDERHEGGGGRYAGNFRHSSDSREHETDEKVKFDEHKAKEWVSRMKNNDGTTGEHFKVEQADQLRNAHCPDCDKHEFWTAMNMMYSDYCDVAKKMNVDRPEFYAHMARAFLMDKDAGEGKMAKYIKYIAGK